MKEYIETQRLRISELELRDADFILKLLNTPDWLQYIGDRGVKTIEHAKKYIAENLRKSYEANGFGLYKVSLKENVASIGLCGFLKREYLEKPDLGFALLPDYFRKGYMHEACVAVMEYGLDTLEMDTLLAMTTADNLKSQNLLKKLGFDSLKTIKPENTELLLFSNEKSHP